ncbi:MAG: acyltransferase family protein [Tannerellaceae bacterium]
MNPYFSDKLKALSFFLIIIVLYIHSGFHDYPHEIQGMPFNHYLQEGISGMIGRCAVPLFYAISGFLFFLNTDKGIKSVYLKMKKRVRTLLVPFIIAALFFPVIVILMDFIPFAGQFMNNNSFTKNLDLPFFTIVKSLFYKVTNGTTPWAFHLWFLRDLILTIILSPILYLTRKYVGGITLIILLFLLNFTQQDIVPAYALFWFMCGSKFLDKISTLRTKWIPISFIILSILELSFPSDKWQYTTIPIISLGVVSIWTVYDKTVSTKFKLEQNKPLFIACQYTFFIYLFHEPTLNIIRKLLVCAIGKTSLGFAATYLLSPWIFVFFFVLLGIVLKRIIPKAYNLCTGGR